MAGIAGAGKLAALFKTEAAEHMPPMKKGPMKGKKPMPPMKGKKPMMKKGEDMGALAAFGGKRGKRY